MSNSIKHVLLVEKNDIYAEQIRQAFERSSLPYEITTARNLHEAKVSINESAPDIIIANLTLPDGKGSQLLESNGYAISIPMVIMVEQIDVTDHIDSIKDKAIVYVFMSDVARINLPSTVEHSLWEHELISKNEQFGKKIKYRRKSEEAISIACEHIFSADDSNLNKTLSITCELLGVDRGFIFRSFKEVEKTQIVSYWQKDISEPEFPFAQDVIDSLAQWVNDEIQQKDYIAISNTSDYLFKNGEEREFVESLTEHSILILPLRSQSGNFSGFISFIDNQKRNKWWREDVRMVNIVARMIGLYWDNQISLKILEDAKSELLQSQKMEAMGRLASGVIHDFNNLLTVITGNSEIAMMAMSESNPLIENFKEISGAAQRAAGLTRQLLSFSRKKPFEAKIINLNDKVTNLISMLNRIIGDQVTLKTVLEKNLLNVKADSGQIEQAIVNLVVNARDAMPDGGNLVIETCNTTIDDKFIALHPGAKAGQKVRMTVSDSGVGMTEKTISRIFDPFFTTKDLNKGTGLGLSTVYGIVKQYDGYIGVESTLGKGTSFHIYLPCVKEDTDVELHELKIENLPRGSESVLVLEDEDSVRAYVCVILKKLGYAVFKSPNGEEALQLCDNLEKPVNLVIVDVVLPKMNGQEFVLKLAEKWKNFKVLYMTGYTISDLIKEGKLDPDTKCLHKPFSPIGLSLKVREVLDE